MMMYDDHVGDDHDDDSDDDDNDDDHHHHDHHSQSSSLRTLFLIESYNENLGKYHRGSRPYSKVIVSL